jgi:hypothetical protein
VASDKKEYEMSWIRDWTFVGARMELILASLGYVKVSEFVTNMALVTTV